MDDSTHREKISMHHTEIHDLKEEIPEEAPRIKSDVEGNVGNQCSAEHSNHATIPPANEHSATPHHPEYQYKPLSILIRVIIASVIMAFCSGISWGYPSLKNNFLNMRVFGRQCSEADPAPCEDQELSLNLMFQLTVSGAQALSVFSGLYFQIFKRRIYLFTVGLFFVFGVCGFGLSLLLKDVPILSEGLHFVCYFFIGFAGLSILMGFLSYQRDVPGRWKSVVSTMINAPFDLSTSIFVIFSFLIGNTGIPLWLLFILHGLLFGAVLCVFSIFMNPTKKRKVAAAEDTAATGAKENVEPNETATVTRKGEGAHEIQIHTKLHSLDNEVSSDDNDNIVCPPMHHEGALSADFVHSVATLEDDDEEKEDYASLQSASSGELAREGSPQTPTKKLRRIFKKLDIRKIIPFRIYLKPEVLVFHIVDTLVVSQLNFYAATVIEQSTWVTGNREDALQLTNVFNLIQPFIGTVISILIGPFLSSFHPTVGVVLVFTTCSLYSIFSLIQVTWLQYVTFFFFFCTRALYFILVGTLVYTLFASQHAPFIYSSILTFSGVFGVGLAYLANYLAVKVFDGSFLIVNLVYGACSVVFLILYFFSVFRLHWKNKRKQKREKDKKEKEEELRDEGEQADISAGNSSASSHADDKTDPHDNLLVEKLEE